MNIIDSSTRNSSERVHVPNPDNLYGLSVTGTPMAMPGCSDSSESVACSLYVNNSIRLKKRSNSSYYRRAQFVCELGLRAICQKRGPNNVIVGALTFSEDVQDFKEGQNRWNSLRTNYLEPLYGEYLRVTERTRNGRIHYHFALSVPFNARYNKIELRKARESLLEALPKYGFGHINQFEPLRKGENSVQRLSSYFSKTFGKYISKAFCKREERDKGMRKYSMSRSLKDPGVNSANVNFQWNDKPSKRFRAGCKALGLRIERWARSYGHTVVLDSSEALSALLGPKWRCRYWDVITALGAGQDGPPLSVIGRHLNGANAPDWERYYNFRGFDLYMSPKATCIY